MTKLFGLIFLIWSIRDVRTLKQAAHPWGYRHALHHFYFYFYFTHQKNWELEQEHRVRVPVFSSFKFWKKFSFGFQFRFHRYRYIVILAVYSTVLIFYFFICFCESFSKKNQILLIFVVERTAVQYTTNYSNRWIEFEFPANNNFKKWWQNSHIYTEVGIRLTHSQSLPQWLRNPSRFHVPSVKRKHGRQRLASMPSKRNPKRFDWELHWYKSCYRCLWMATQGALHSSWRLCWFRYICLIRS